MGSSIYGIGVSALSAAQAGLVTTGHNISNVNTSGYHRQQIVQSTNIPQFTGIGFLGQGVHVDTVKRLYDEILDNQVMQAQTQSSQLESYYAQIKQIDNMLADPNAGLSPALQDFFNGVHDVAANPASIPSRQSMLSSGEALVSRFQALDQRLREIRDGVNSEISSSVGVINSYAQQIANLNQQIALAQSASSAQQPANDLLDQRDQLIAELNKYVRATTVKQDDGSYNIFIGNGQTLVIGQQSFNLAAVPSPEDPERLEVGVTSGGSTILLGKDSLQGGSLGGVLAFRSETLDPAQNALGRVAIGLAQTFNDQHRLGQDLNGDLGGNFFNVPSPKVVTNVNNGGTATVSSSFSDVGLLTTSDYKMVATDALGGFTLTRLSDGATVTPASEGLTLNLAAGANVGDSWLVQPTRNGARDITVAITDTAKIAAAAPISTNAAMANTGTGKISAGVVVDTTNAAFTTIPGSLTPPILIRFTSAITYSVYDNTDPAAPVLLQGGIGYNPAVSNEVFPTPALGNLDYGYRIALSGSPAANDEFTVNYNNNGVSDNRNALLLAGLQTQNTLAGGTTSSQGAYSQLVSFVGNKTREVEVTAKAQANLVSQTQQAQQSMSGVNLDEEAANLMRYQQAYQAAGKMMQIAAILFDTLLSIGQ